MTGRLDTVLEEIAKRNFVKIDTEVFLDGGELEKAVEEAEKIIVIDYKDTSDIESALPAAKLLLEGSFSPETNLPSTIS